MNKSRASRFKKLKIACVSTMAMDYRGQQPQRKPCGFRLPILNLVALGSILGLAQFKGAHRN